MAGQKWRANKWRAQEWPGQKWPSKHRRRDARTSLFKRIRSLFVPIPDGHDRLVLITRVRDADQPTFPYLVGELSRFIEQGAPRFRDRFEHFVVGKHIRLRLKVDSVAYLFER